MLFTKEQGELYQLRGYLRRICDVTSPNLPRLDEGRGEDRVSRTVPVLLTTWENNRPVLRETTTALTRDISDRGLSVTLCQAFHAENVVVGFWIAGARGCGPWFFLAAVRHNVAIGGGFWALGLEVLRRLTSQSEIAGLMPLIREVLPPKTAQPALVAVPRR